MQSTVQLVMQVESINLNTVSDIQKYLEPDDVISLIFLLEEYHERALVNLIRYHQVSELGGNSFNILLDWAKDAACKRDFWKWEFVEALFVCQLFSALKKVGLDIYILKQHFLSCKYYIHPIKKQLYKVCEHLNSNSYEKLKNKLAEHYNILITDYKNNEILFLQLMCKGILSISSCTSNIETVNVDTITKVLEDIQELSELTTEMKRITASFNNTYQNMSSFCGTPRVSRDREMDVAKEKLKNRILFVNDFNESFELLNQLTLEDPNLNLKMDKL